MSVIIYSAKQKLAWPLFSRLPTIHAQKMPDEEKQGRGGFEPVIFGEKASAFSHTATRVFAHTLFFTPTYSLLTTSFCLRVAFSSSIQHSYSSTHITVTYVQHTHISALENKKHKSVGKTENCEPYFLRSFIHSKLRVSL